MLSQRSHRVANRVFVDVKVADRQKLYAQRKEANRQSGEELQAARQRHISMEGIIPDAVVRNIHSEKEYFVVRVDVDAKGIVVRCPQTGKETKFAPDVLLLVSDKEKSEQEVV